MYFERDQSSAGQKGGCSGLTEEALQGRGHLCWPSGSENSNHFLQRGLGIWGKGTGRHKGAGVRQRETCVGELHVTPFVSWVGVFSRKLSASRNGILIYKWLKPLGQFFSYWTKSLQMSGFRDGPAAEECHQGLGTPPLSVLPAPVSLACPIAGGGSSQLLIPPSGPQGERGVAASPPPPYDDIKSFPNMPQTKLYPLIYLFIW